MLLPIRRTRFSSLAFACVVLTQPFLSCIFAVDVAVPHLQTRLRHPMALALMGDGQSLIVANRQSGSISIVDADSGKLVGEQNVGRQLADIKLLPGDRGLLAVDEAAGELILLRRDDQQWPVISRLKVSATPVSVVVSESGDRCYVASLWSRRLTVVDLVDIQKPEVRHVVDLPFSPRSQLLLEERGLLLVADSFGGQVAVVDTENVKMRGVRTFDGHNIRGMALTSDGQTLLMPHQILHSERTTTGDGVHWGGVMSNVIRDVTLDELLAEESGPLSEVGGVYYLGYPDSATGDPTDLVITSDGRQILCFAGISQIAISDVGVNAFKRIDVGTRPTALALSPDEQTVYAANTFSDSISVVDVTSGKQTAEISLGPRPKLELAEQGEVLFYDARLSSDGWYSCHSCHTDGHSNGGRNDNFGDESYGAPKRVLSLLGTSHTGPWAWNGQSAKLEQQIRKSIEVTMQGDSPSDEQVAALAAYVRTLKPPPALPRLHDAIDETRVARGRDIFERQGCTDCHAPPTYTSPDKYDVGFKDELGYSQFNPPSLLGVGHRERLFHDNRATGLRDAVTRLKHGLTSKMSADEVNELVHFLNSL